MYFYESGPLDVEVASRIGDYDAVVTNRVSEDAYHRYTTVDAAIAANATNILVKRGTYPGFTVDNAGVIITCESQSTYDPGTNTFKGGVRFTSTISITAAYVTLVNASVSTESGHGISVTGDFAVLRNCQACACADSGIYTNKNTIIMFGAYSGNATHGINAVAADGFFVSVVGCIAEYNTSAGIYVGDATGDNRSATISACICRYNNKGVDSNYPAQDAKIVMSSDCRHNTTSAITTGFTTGACVVA